MQSILKRITCIILSLFFANVFLYTLLVLVFAITAAFPMYIVNNKKRALNRHFIESQCFYFLSGKMLGIYVLTFGLIKFGKHKYRYDYFALKLSTINVEIEYCMRSIFYLCFIVLAYLQKLLLKVLGCCRNGCHLKRVSKSCLVIFNFR